MSFEQPAYGTERIVLDSPQRAGDPYVIRRQVFAEGPPVNYYDEAAKDFVTWRGSWTLVETLGAFDSPDKARAFMVAREVRTRP